jgi:peptide/nickel transport system substrate-binding protein
MKLRIPAISILALTFILSAGCGGPAPPDVPPTSDGPRQGGTLVLGSISDVDSWNEYLSQQSFAGNLLRRIFLRLAQEQGAGNSSPLAYRPLLAESWEFSEDGRTLTFRLRQASWSDGTPISSSDVRFTWLAQTSPDVPWAGGASKEHITDVEAIDDRTVAFHFDSNYPFQLADAVEGGILPAHLFGPVPFELWASYDWAQIKVGSGPFLLGSHRPGQETVLVRNPYYYDEGYPLLDRVVVRYVPDINNLLTQLLAGDIDYVEGVPPRDAHRLVANRDIVVVTFDYPGYDYIGWNGSGPPFNDALLRRAMTLAIDRQALVEDLLYGYGRVSNGPLPSSWWGADRDLQPWPFDPGQARRLLAERGYATTNDDGSAASGGRTLELTLLTNSGNRLREDMLVKIQEQLARIGVRAHTQPLEMRTMREKVGSGNYDAYLGGWVFVGKVEIGMFFGSVGLPPQGYNVVNYRSPEVDRLLGVLGEATQWQDMKATLDEIQSNIHEDQPYSFLYETKRVAAYGPRLRGVTIDIPSDPLAHLERFWVVSDH